MHAAAIVFAGGGCPVCPRHRSRPRRSRSGAGGPPNAPPPRIQGRPALDPPPGVRPVRRHNGSRLPRARSTAEGSASAPPPWDLAAPQLIHRCGVHWCTTFTDPGCPTLDPLPGSSMADGVCPACCRHGSRPPCSHSASGGPHGRWWPPYPPL